MALPNPTCARRLAVGLTFTLEPAMIRFLVLVLTIATLSAAESAANLPDGLLAADAPVDAVDVVAARTAIEPGATITVRGVIGGRPKPIADQRAIFTIIDRNLVCDTACGKGWSGCGNGPEALKAGTATVQIVDTDGKPLAATIEGANGLVPGATVVIRGIVAATSNANLLIVTAQRIHIEPQPN